MLAIVPIRVFLCDDVPAFRALVRAVLEDDARCEVVGEAGDGVRGVAGIAATQPDVILLDLDMPGGDGLTALPAIRAAAPCARIVILSSAPAAQMAPRTLAAGANHYLEKRAPMAQITALVLDEAQAA
jgi:DNA-binding NarL/FixJ family response regulator